MYGNEFELSTTQHNTDPIREGAVFVPATFRTTYERTTARDESQADQTGCRSGTPALRPPRSRFYEVDIVLGPSLICHNVMGKHVNAIWVRDAGGGGININFQHTRFGAR